jgi:hypothetical protein
MFYIATFYSHFGAVRFKSDNPYGVHSARLMPVPRKLSSSCGTCVRFEAAADFTVTADPHGEIEQIVRESNDSYVTVFRAEEA